MALDGDQMVIVASLRRLIPDKEALPNPAHPDEADSTMFSDDELFGYYTDGASSIYRGAALAIDAVAFSEALIAKAITTEDMSTDGAKVMNAMRLKAERFYVMADRVEADAADSGFEVIPFVLDPPQWEWR